MTVDDKRRGAGIRGKWSGAGTQPFKGPVLSRIPDACLKDTLRHLRIAIVCGCRPVAVDQPEILFAYRIRSWLQLSICACCGRKRCARTHSECTCEAEKTCTGVPG